MLHHNFDNFANGSYMFYHLCHIFIVYSIIFVTVNMLLLTFQNFVFMILVLLQWLHSPLLCNLIPLQLV